MHPEWEHLFFNHYQAQDWVAEHTPEWIDLYNFYPLDRQREQIFRWLALWKLGGFWLGTKLRPLVSLETLRERSLVLAVQQRMRGDEFEALHRIPPPPDLPPAAMFRLADLYLEAGEARRDEAIVELQYLLGHAPERVELYKALASLYRAEHELAHQKRNGHHRRTRG